MVAVQSAALFVLGVGIMGAAAGCFLMGRFAALLWLALTAAAVLLATAIFPWASVVLALALLARVTWSVPALAREVRAR
jgi:hypothetical protein